MVFPGNMEFSSSVTPQWNSVIELFFFAVSENCFTFSWWIFNMVVTSNIWNERIVPNLSLFQIQPQILIKFHRLMFEYDQMLKNTCKYHTKKNKCTCSCNMQTRAKSAKLLRSSICTVAQNKYVPFVQVLLKSKQYEHWVWFILYDGVGVDGSHKKPYSTFTFEDYSNIWDCRIRVIFNWFHLL